MPPPPPGAVPTSSPILRGKTARNDRPALGVVVEARAGGLVLRLGTPNPASWTAEFRAEVTALLRRLRAEADGGIVVLTGARIFERDDETALARHSKLPDFSDLLAAIAAPGAPVIAAIPGHAFGGGLELALACHARVATPHASFGLPDVLHGRLPANGGIPHLGALVDAESALAMLAFGEPVSASAALRIGLIDAVAPADPVECAIALGPKSRPPRSAVRNMLAMRNLVLRRAPGQTAPLAALHALDQAWRLPLQRALAETRNLALALHHSAEAAALRHAACAARQALELPPEARNAFCWALLREAIHLLDDGATPRQVDLALRGFGLHVPPFVGADRLGLDIVARDWIDPRPDAWHRYSPIFDLMLDRGRLGRTAGRGWYAYPAGQTQPQPDPEVERLLAEAARAAQRPRGTVTAPDIIDRCIRALIAEATKLLQDGIVADTLTLDALSLTLGFPAWRGGIWYHAETIGQAKIAIVPLRPAWQAEGRSAPKS